MLSSIEEDELVIKFLEEIDENFSAIKSTLRELKFKISRLAEKNSDIIDDCMPWINFFETEAKIDYSPLSELHLNALKYKEVNNSPIDLNYTKPNNPFIEAESSELLNKTVFKKAHANLTSCSASSSTPVFFDRTRADCSIKATDKSCQDSDENELLPFQVELLPAVFQQEKDLSSLYNFIQSNKTVSVEDVISNFTDISHEKIEILVTLLCRKNFVKQKNGKLTVEK